MLYPLDPPPPPRPCTTIRVQGSRYGFLRSHTNNNPIRYLTRFPTAPLQALAVSESSPDLTRQHAHTSLHRVDALSSAALLCLHGQS
jgi:hypothetical protein